MPYSTVLCLDDLTRAEFWPAKEFMYDLIRLPVYYAAGIDIACSPRNGQRHNLGAGFDIDRFLALCRGARANADWVACHHEVPQAAALELARHIPDGALVVSYEMPPWLRKVLDRRGCDWIDLRLAPLRFATDLYMAARTNRPALHAALQRHAVSPHAIHFEAMMLAARVRHHRRYTEDNLALDGSVVYLGQTEADAAIIDSNGRFVRIGDRAEPLREAVGAAPVLYRAHPQGGAFANEEQREIERLIGRPVTRCEVETYDLMAGDAGVKLVGLSSGALQEAGWFGREAVALLDPICRPEFGAAWNSDTYQLLASHDFISEPLWAELTTGTAPRADAVRIAPRPNLLRELHNAWWGYSSASIRNSHFYREVVDLHSGDLRDRLAATEGRLAAANRDIEQLRDQLAQTLDAVRGLLTERRAVAA